METKTIIKTYEIQKDIIQDEQRIITLYASTKDIDREGDTIQPTAWDKNKIVGKPLLFNHDRNKPIGKIISANVNSRGLVIQAWISETAKDIWTWIKEEILTSASVGFRGLEGTRTETGWDFSKCDMIETSLTPTPCNEYSEILAWKSLAITPEGIEFCDNKLKDITIKELNDKILKLDDTIISMSVDEEKKVMEIETLKSELQSKETEIKETEKELQKRLELSKDNTNNEIKNRIESLLKTVKSLSK